LASGHGEGRGGVSNTCMRCQGVGVVAQWGGPQACPMCNGGVRVCVRCGVVSSARICRDCEEAAEQEIAEQQGAILQREQRGVCGGVSERVTIRCVSCYGTGSLGYVTPCLACDGTGRVDRPPDGLALQAVVEWPELVPEYKTAGSAGLDLAVKEAVIVRPGEVTMVGTGVRVAIPEGYVGLVYSRSSVASQARVVLANKVGVIDSDYRGEIMLPLMYEGLEKYTIIEKGTRVAQLIVQPIARVQVQVVDELPATERGSGGFGSTGEGA